MKNVEVLILGGGPAGMSAAFELHKSGKHFVIIEKNETVGGLARTLYYGEFRTDIGPHRFFSQNPYLNKFIGDLIDKHWIKVDRLTRFYIDGKFFLYPIELKDVLTNIGFLKSFKILSDYFLQQIKNVFIRKPSFSFQEQIIKDFGRTLAEFNMINYTEKIWGLPCSEISCDWVKQRIKGLSLKEVIKKSIIKSTKGPKTLIDQFYYPDMGIGLIWEKIREIIINGKTGVINLNSYPLEIIHTKEKIAEVIVNINGKQEIIKPDYVLSSIPITEFVNLLKPEVPQDILIAVNTLKFRSHISLFITINKPLITNDQWIYFPDKEIPFGRVMEPKNFSNKLAPKDKTSLLVEFFCWENDKLWNATKEELFKKSIDWLEKIGFVKSNEVINYFIHKEKYAYPVYDLYYKEHLSKVKNFLKNFKNLKLIGRSGCFRYNNIDHAMEMGILAARNIIEGKQYNIEEIGTKPKYLEDGYIKT